ncbi:MAG: hypothetical protein KDM63_17765, partial [Verrucomicrobiae bacterium]|nr:hypothetical protein [Verrucomicrobiae bacterium]
VAILLGVGVLLLVAVNWVYDKLQMLKSLDTLEAEIVRDFPDVEHVTSAELALWQGSEPGLLLIDCRKPEEYAVSRIPGAVNLRTAGEVSAYLEQNHLQPARIVSYCAVGWRSAKLTRALTREGIPNAVNLRGAIFHWANEDRPLEKPDGTPASTVHPVHEIWSGLLKEGKAEP